MRKVIAVGGLFSCAVLALGCPKKKGDAVDAAAEAEAPTAVVVDAGATPAPVAAKNAADVARFPAETAVTDDDAKLESPAPVRTAPKTGSILTTLKPKADVTKIAEYQGSILVSFADPKDANTTLMGWIGKEAFSAPAYVKTDAGVTDAGLKDAGTVTRDAGGGSAKPLACGAGMVAVVLAKDPVCRKRCTKDADCKGGAAGSCANANAAAGGIARVCAIE